VTTSHALQPSPLSTVQTARLLARFLPSAPPAQHAPPPGAEQQHQEEPAWVSRLMVFYHGVLHHGRVLPTGCARS